MTVMTINADGDDYDDDGDDAINRVSGIFLVRLRTLGSLHLLLLHL